MNTPLRLAFVLDEMDEAVMLLDREFRVLYANRQALQMDERPLHELIGRTHWELWPPSFGTPVEQNYRQALEEGAPRAFEHRYVSDTHDVWIGVRAIPTGEGLALFYRDIGDRMRMQEALVESNRRLNAVLDNASVAIFLMDERQHCAYMNTAAQQLTGYRFEETLGRPLHDVVHHTYPDGRHFPLEECPIDRAFPENAQEQGETVFVHKDGSFYPVAFTASPIRDETSKTIGTIIEVRDISAEKRTEEARELLIREVDHRARNALTVVQSVLQLTRAPDIETYKEIVFGRVSAMARAQSSLARRQWEDVDLRDLVCDELAAAVDEEQFEISGPTLALPPEQAQPVSMVVHELTTNARKYGALSVARGRLRVGWELHGGVVELTWRECDGPAVSKPINRGFGSTLIEQLTRQLGGQAAYEWSAAGLGVKLVWPL